MKSYSSYQKTRIAYHKDAKKNTVHRSSLLVPRFEQAETNISFVNHFLIKRNIQEVSLKVTAVNKNGEIIDSITYEIDKPIVYSLFLDEMFDDINLISLYIVEFFSGKNLFIPFPAVMVNHIGADFTNSVHSYNRTLNDIFEDDQINKNHVFETSFDVLIDEEHDTFFNFVSGPFEINNNIEVSLRNQKRTIESRLDISQKRLSSSNHFLGDILTKEIKKNISTDLYSDIARILPPKQNLFYGRLLSGVMNKKTNAFSANHSYYDSSNFEEYFDNNQSFRVYPYFGKCSNRISIYPIMSPSTIEFHIEILKGNEVFKSPIKILNSPSSEVITFEVNDIVEMSGFKNVSLFKIVAISKEKIPTRVTHQLIYSPKQSRSKLNCTIAINLANSGMFVPKNKTGLCWGQVLVNNEYSTNLGISFNDNSTNIENVDIDFYGAEGLLKTVSSEITPSNSLIFDTNFFRELTSEDQFIWYTAKSNRPDLSAKYFHYHNDSHNAAGEHSF